MGSVREDGNGDVHQPGVALVSARLASTHRLGEVQPVAGRATSPPFTGRMDEPTQGTLVVWRENGQGLLAGRVIDRDGHPHQVVEQRRELGELPRLREPPEVDLPRGRVHGGSLPKTAGLIKENVKEIRRISVEPESDGATQYSSSSVATDPDGRTFRGRATHRVVTAGHRMKGATIMKERNLSLILAGTLALTMLAAAPYAAGTRALAPSRRRVRKAISPAAGSTARGSGSGPGRRGEAGPSSTSIRKFPRSNCPPTRGPDTRPTCQIRWTWPNERRWLPTG